MCLQSPRWHAVRHLLAKTGNNTLHILMIPLVMLQESQNFRFAYIILASFLRHKPPLEHSVMLRAQVQIYLQYSLSICLFLYSLLVSNSWA